MPETPITRKALEAIIANQERLPKSTIVDEGLAWLRMHLAALDKRQRLVFRSDMPGYVTLGRDGEERTFVNPDLAGVGYAWRIFLAGEKAQHVLHAFDLLGAPCKQPGNALGNALTRAADWIEYQAACPALAIAVRSISVSKDGRIHYDPARGPEIILM